MTDDITWKQLSDMWIFDLKKCTWAKRKMVPAIQTSYHSMVGYAEGDTSDNANRFNNSITDTVSAVACFGGYRLKNYAITNKVSTICIAMMIFDIFLNIQIYVLIFHNNVTISFPSLDRL